MLVPQTPTLIKSLAEHSDTAKGRVSVFASDLPLNAASITSREFYVNDYLETQQRYSLCNGDAEQRYREIHELLTQAVQDAGFDWGHIWQAWETWNFFLPGIGACNAEGLENRFMSPLIESAANAIEHGCTERPFELELITSSKEMAVIIRNYLDEASAAKAQKSLDAIQEHCEPFRGIHHDIDNASGIKNKLEIARRLSDQASRIFRSPIASAQAIEGGHLPNYMYRGNCSVSLAENRTNYAWRKLEKTTFTQYLLLSNERFQQVEEEIKLYGKRGYFLTTGDGEGAG